MPVVDGLQGVGRSVLPLEFEEIMDTRRTGNNGREIEVLFTIPYENYSWLRETFYLIEKGILVE